MEKDKIGIAFFGTSKFAVLILEELKGSGFTPSLIVTTGDKPKGRKLVLTPPEAKIWATQNNVPFIQPRFLKTPEVTGEIKKHFNSEIDLFIVASYGKIIPQNILDIPKYKTLNVHPSLLPKLRGASPIQSAILSENETGVTIMRLDAEMDHGPIVAQEKVLEWDIENVPYSDDLENTLGKRGGQILAEMIPDWMSGKIKEVEQNHELATFCKKIEKEDGLLDLNDSAEINLRKIRGYNVWPGAYFFTDRKGDNIRVIVKRARIDDNKLVLERVVPEGKKEMDYADFLRG